MSLNGFSGAAGIKYGLNVRGAAKRSAPLPRPQLSAFAAPSDDEEEAGATEGARANAQIARQQQSQRECQKTEELYASALAEDASVFDYDGVYDQMKASKGASAPAAQAGRGQARYIGQLLVAAKEREREADVVFERRTVKERQKEDHLFGDKDKFVTAAYKAKMAEDAAWTEAERVRNEREAQSDVTKRRDMSAFYTNLLTKNTAFGGAEAAAKPPVRAQHAGEQAAEADAPRDEPPRAPAAVVAAAEPHVAPALQRVDVGRAEAQEDAVVAHAQAAAAAAAAAILPAAGGKRERAGEEAVASARERYLARKKAKPEDA